MTFEVSRTERTKYRVFDLIRYGVTDTIIDAKVGFDTGTIRLGNTKIKWVHSEPSHYWTPERGWTIEPVFIGMNENVLWEMFQSLPGRKFKRVYTPLLTFVQKEDEGPPCLVIENERVVAGYHSDERTGDLLPFPESFYTWDGYWKNSEAEYLAREMMDQHE